MPAPSGDDADGVKWALSTATSLWRIDQRDDALRWLRRAAEAANEAGATARASELLVAMTRLMDEAPPTTRTPAAPSSCERDERSGDGRAKDPADTGTSASRIRPPRAPEIAKPPPLPVHRTAPVRAAPPPRPPVVRPSRAPRIALGAAGHAALRVAVRVVGTTVHVEPLAHGREAPAGWFAATLVPERAVDGDMLLAASGLLPG